MLYQSLLIISFFLLSVAAVEFGPICRFNDFKHLIDARLRTHELILEVPRKKRDSTMKSFLKFHPLSRYILMALQEDSLATFDPLVNLISNHFKKPYRLKSIYLTEKWTEAIFRSVKTLSLENPELTELFFNDHVFPKYEIQVTYRSKASDISSFRFFHKLVENAFAKTLITDIQAVHDNIHGNQRFLSTISMIGKFLYGKFLLTDPNLFHLLFMLRAAKTDLELTLNGIIQSAEANNFLEIAENVHRLFVEKDPSVIVKLVENYFVFNAPPKIYDELIYRCHFLLIAEFIDSMNNHYSSVLGDDFPQISKLIVRTIVGYTEIPEIREFFLFAFLNYPAFELRCLSTKESKLFFTSFLYNFVKEFSLKFPYKIEAVFPGMTQEALLFDLYIEFKSFLLKNPLQNKLQLCAFLGHWHSIEVIREIEPIQSFNFDIFKNNSKMMFNPDLFIRYMELIKTVNIPQNYQDKYLEFIAADGHVESLKYLIESSGFTFSENAKNKALKRSILSQNIYTLEYILSIPGFADLERTLLNCFSKSILLPWHMLEYLFIDRFSLLTDKLIEAGILQIFDRSYTEGILKFLIEESGFEFKQALKDKTLLLASRASYNLNNFDILASSWEFSQNAKDSAFLIAVKEERYGILGSLLDKFNLKISDEGIEAAFHVSLHKQKPKLFEILVKHFESFDKTKLLMLTLIPSKIEFLQILLNNCTFDKDLLGSAYEKSVRSGYTNAAELLKPLI